MSNTEVLTVATPTQSVVPTAPVKVKKVRATRKPSLAIPIVLIILGFVAQGVIVPFNLSTAGMQVAQFVLGAVVNLLIVWFFVNIFRRMFGFAKVNAPKVNKAMKAAKKLKG